MSKTATVFVALGVGTLLITAVFLFRRSDSGTTANSGLPNRSRADLNDYGAYPPNTQQSPRPGPPGAAETVDRAEAALGVVRGGLSLYEEFRRVFH